MRADTADQAGRLGGTPSDQAGRPLKVLYIAGWGRSGTTILDNILGSIDGFFSVGEISYLWKRGLLTDGRCGCGGLVRDCELWSAVLAQPFENGTIGDVDPRRVVHWQQEVARVRHTWRILRGGGSTDPENHYAALLAATYRAVARVTNSRVLIDSSKRPSNGAILTTMDDVDPYILQMVRDPRAVAFSWQRQKAQPGFARGGFMLKHGVRYSTQSWITWNLASSKLRQRVGADHSMLLRYEDFIDHPRKIAEAVVEMLGERAGELPFEDDRTVRLSPNHTVSGNPSRFKLGNIELRRDDEWRTAQPGMDRFVATAMSAPLLKRYGYGFRVSRDPTSDKKRQEITV